MSGPLEGIRVLDWTQYQMGPVATSLLADFGAEVIHIEHRVTGDAGRGLNTSAASDLPGGRRAYFETNNRGKKSLAIDLAKPEGQEVIYRLVAKSDVFAHNFRQGVPERLNLDYETLSRINPSLVYAASSGYGPKGAEAAEPAFDFVALARSGISSFVTPVDGDPNLPGAGIADQMGGVMTSYGILMALLARERQGIGQQVDVSHLSSMITLQGLGIGLDLFRNHEPGPRPTRKQATNPLRNCYLCSDGRWIFLANAQPDRRWPAFCRALGITNLENDPKYATAVVRRENCQELIVILDEIFLTKTPEEWMKVLKGAGDIVCTPLQTIRDLPEDPQVIANQYLIDVEHETLGMIKVRGLPVALSKTPGTVRPVAPEFGQHTEEVLIDVGGYSREEITELREKGSHLTKTRASTATRRGVGIRHWRCWLCCRTP